MLGNVQGAFRPPPAGRELTLSLVGGRIALPPASFSALYGKRLKMGTWNFFTFPAHSLGMLCQIFEFLLCAEAPPGPLSRGHVCQASANFFQIFGNCKNLIVCDWLVYWETWPEIRPKSFKKQRSHNNFKHLVKKRRMLFLSPWTPNFRIFWIFENVSCSSRWEKSNGVYPIEIGLTVLEISWGVESAPPHQLTSSRKPTSNRVKGGQMEIGICSASELFIYCCGWSSMLKVAKWRLVTLDDVVSVPVLVA